jgi:hypothetical protein
MFTPTISRPEFGCWLELRLRMNRKQQAAEICRKQQKRGNYGLNDYKNRQISP